MAFNIQTYHRNLDKISEEYGCSRAQAKDIYKASKNGSGHGVVPKVRESMTPEQLVSYAREQISSIELQIQELSMTLANHNDRLKQWQLLANALPQAEDEEVMG